MGFIGLGGPPYPPNQESLYGPLEASDREYRSHEKPGAKVVLVAYQDRSIEGSGYLVRIPDTLPHHFYT